VLEQILVSMFSAGHVLIVGVPGLAKTLLVRTLADTLQLHFSRIQFTPDLMPSDITGTEVIQQDVATGQRELKFIRGPIFANMILADEINRTPPKTQAALLEAMQEQQVTVSGTRHVLDRPFMVLATQNPIEQEGTYPLPEALLDRFMMQIMIRYPDEADELAIVKRTTSGRTAPLSQRLSADRILTLTELIRQIPVADHVALYAIRLARLTRLVQAGEGDSGFVPDRLSAAFTEIRRFVTNYVRWGAGPRAGQFMVLAGKARAALDGRHCVSTDDIRALACPVLRHRIRTNFQASSENVTADQIVSRLMDFLDRLDENESGIDKRLFGSARTG
jgi:MoxR-like ATPase